jgi:predicted nucleotidyltransferase
MDMLNGNTLTVEDLKTLSLQLPEKIPYLKMLVLFGSRATSNTTAESDWDFAALYDKEMRRKQLKDNTWEWFEVPLILGELFNLNSDQIDVVDLSLCQPLITHSVARDGKLIYEHEKGEFERFKQKALLSVDERQAIRKQLRHNIDNFLKEWGLI